MFDGRRHDKSTIRRIGEIVKRKKETVNGESYEGFSVIHARCGNRIESWLREMGSSVRASQADRLV